MAGGFFIDYGHPETVILVRLLLALFPLCFPPSSLLSFLLGRTTAMFISGPGITRK
jgi:hypothetical protein